MPRRVLRGVPEPGKEMGTAQICRESIRVVLLRPSHFNSISTFLFSPVPVSLFIAHLLARRFPGATPFIVRPVRRLLEQTGAPAGLLRVLTSSAFSAAVCLPSSLTFALLGRAATARSVARSYRGAGLAGRRVFFANGGVWTRLLETCVWEFAIVLGLCFLLVAALVAVLKVVDACGGCSGAWCFWGALGFLGVPFSVGFAHLVVVGNLASVVTVLESECSGLQALARAKALVEKRRQTALCMALLSNVGMRLVEGLFELRLRRGMRMWEGSLLVSMYSFTLVIQTVQNVVFYCTTQP